jgi:hypothetical protein
MGSFVRECGKFQGFESVQVQVQVRVFLGLLLYLCLHVCRILPMGLLRGELFSLRVVALVLLVPLRATSVTHVRVPPNYWLGESVCSTLAIYIAPLSRVSLLSRLLSLVSEIRLFSTLCDNTSPVMLPMHFLIPVLCRSVTTTCQIPLSQFFFLVLTRIWKDWLTHLKGSFTAQRERFPWYIKWRGHQARHFPCWHPTAH